MVSRRAGTPPRPYRIRARVLDALSFADVARELERTDSDPEGVAIMTQKARVFLVRVDRVPLKAAPLLKQEMIAVGGDSAHARGVASLTVDSSSVVTLGTMSQYRRAGPKLRRQPFQLHGIAEAIDSAIRNVTQRRSRKLPALHRAFTIGDRPRVMGVVNVTPDSFSDGGRFAEPASAVTRALRLESEGASVIDVGAESTRPGATAIPPREEWRRLAPVLTALNERLKVPLSIDTRHASVARQALAGGADMVNDVSGLVSAEMRRVIARTGAPVVVMHMRGTPVTMASRRVYSDLRQEVFDELGDRVDRALGSGVAPDQILIDPGLGFAKDAAQSLELLRHVGEFRSLGFPVVVGASRKSFLGRVLGEAPVEEREEASLAAAVVAALQGIELVRAHEVASTVKALRVVEALSSSPAPRTLRGRSRQPGRTTDAGTSSSRTSEPT
ncbi:MAG: dihydropteroate synthase [Thermoplasmata archaeon]